MLAYFFYLCYARYMRNAGNETLTLEQQKLVEDNIKLVYYLAEKNGIHDEDLIQEGMLGLVNAARYYSSDFGCKFSTYAGSYIWSALHGTYSDKKNKLKAAVTSSLDDLDLNIQASSKEDFGCFIDFKSDDPLANDIFNRICAGFTKDDIHDLLGIELTQINSILDKVGRQLYGERYDKKTGRRIPRHRQGGGR